MAYLSGLYGRQVNKAVILSAHSGVGSMLTFDSSAKFPAPSDLILESCICGYIVNRGVTIPDDVTDEDMPKYGIPEKFNYKDTSTRNIYIDSSANMMYRWKHYTEDEWGADHWEYDEKNKTWIKPEKPNPEDYGGETTDEYKEALEAYNESKYPVYYKKDLDGKDTDVEIPDTAGYTYVACAGGGGSDLYWTKI